MFNWFKKKTPVAPLVTPPRPEKKLSISHLAAATTASDSKPLFELTKPLPVMVGDKKNMAFDSWAFPLSVAPGVVTVNNADLQFIGYPELAVLSQRPEYRLIVETFARETTRKWIKLTTTGDDDKADFMAELDDKINKYHVRRVLRRALEIDGYFGRGHIYIDVDGHEGEELEKPLILDPIKLKKGTKVTFRAVEALWCYPAEQNTTDPLAPDFYNPTHWYVMGRKVHRSRLLTIIGREVTDILRPVYMFGGLSLIQMSRPYVDNWLRTRQSVSDITHNFSVSGIKTDMDGVLYSKAADELRKRAELLTKTRDNQGLLLLNRDTEEYFNTSTPLGTLDKLQAQSQEQIASIAGIPIIVLLGITPSGLNASADPELEAWANRVKSDQERTHRDPITIMQKVIQLVEFGEIDESVDFEFNPLKELNEIERSQVRLTDAQTETAYIGAGVLDGEDVRTRLAHDENSLYNGIDLSAPPEPELDTDPQDDEDDDPAQDGWVTVHPNGPDNKGTPVLLDKKGNIVGGMGGKFNGKHVSEVSKSESSNYESLNALAMKATNNAKITREAWAHREAIAAHRDALEAYRDVKDFDPAKAKLHAAAIRNHTTQLARAEEREYMGPRDGWGNRIAEAHRHQNAFEDDDPAQDAWEESKHPRRDDGKFGTSAGSKQPNPIEMARVAHPNNPLSKVKVDHLPAKSEIHQPAKTFEALEAKGTEALKQFTDMLNTLGLSKDITNPEKITVETKGSYLFIAPNKSKTRSAEKVNADYGGDYSKLLDYVRATITVDSYDDIAGAIEKAQKAGIEFACKPADKVTKPSSVGYRDVNTTVKLPNGMMAELQFNTNAMIAAKNKGHIWYEGQQRLERKNGNAPLSDWDERDRSEYEELEQNQLRVYGEAYARSA